MHGLIQNVSLGTSRTLSHAARVYPDTPVVTAREGTVIHRTTYTQVDHRARKLASSLTRLDLADENTVIGALAFNGWRLFEVMHAIPGMGAVLHTANPRLHEDHLAYTLRHAADRAVLVDLDCLPLAEAIQPRCPSVREWIILCSRDELPTTTLPQPLCYEELTDTGDSSYEWPELDERQASTLCFTSATTGEPKGVLYSHRGTLLNILSIVGKNGWDLGRDDCVLATAPFFHCNGWGMPYMAPLVGAKLVLPGRAVNASAMLNLIHTEGVTHTGGVPTVLMDLLNEAKTEGRNLAALRMLWTGGAAPPESLIQDLEALGPKVVHAFGMTETTQALTVAAPSPRASPKARRHEQLTQGQPIFLSDVRTVDEEGDALPNDGRAIGHVQVRGPAVASAYYSRSDLTPVTSDGWLQTGDIGTVDSTGHLVITDRAKDAIKSGGEWISSVTLENIATGCPGVSEASCVAVDHPRWQERPLLLIVRAPGAELEESALRRYLIERVARWWMPDAILFVDALPRNGVGKVMKSQLRDSYKNILLERGLPSSTKGSEQ